MRQETASVSPRLAVVALLVAVGVGAEDAAENAREQGASVEPLIQECDGCHGEGGRSAEPEVPSIGGFSDYAIIDLLESYRTGSARAAQQVARTGRKRT